MLKAILFDLDGTLLDRDESLKQFLHSQYHSILELRKIEFNLFKERFIALDQRGYVWKDVVYEQIIDEFDLNISSVELLADYLKRFQSHCVGFKGLHEILKEVKKQGLKLGIITNGYSEFQRANINGLGITEYFDEIIVSEEEKIKKPDTRIFEMALNRLKVNASDAMYVGDHPINDVEASIKAGMIGIWKEDLYYKKPGVACITIKELIELKDILGELVK